MRHHDAEGQTAYSHPPIELAVAENTLFALPPINRIVPTTKTKMTASITAYRPRLRQKRESSGKSNNTLYRTQQLFQPFC